ncbi:MAG: glycine--tRNA ligase subunit beta, partial [Endomicrobium sp.]|nr:glycine--tRNA ligase subunit beta [Endomicrobium sp.]
KSYLNLPFEVLNTCIKKIQKCFLVFDKKNNLSNYFVCIKNGISKYKKDIKNGYEKVVTARLSDAEFFYNKDLKNGLEYNIEKLKNIVLYNDAGTIYDKIIRIKRVAFFLNKEFNMMIDNNILERAIMLSKTDLVTEMVFEYPHLQGVIGKIYALKLGESNDVADSIEQHYWPLTASSKLPINNVAFLVSISDKIDTLVISFLIGISYSGSEDQHGLRRYGIGFMRMIIERLPNCNLEYIVKKIFDFLLNDTVNCVTLKKSYDNLIKFLYKRMESVFVSYGYQICDIKAVINTSMNKSNNSIRILKLKLEALRNARMNPGLSSIVIIFKRMTNIIHQAKEQGVNISKIIDENLLILNIEKTIYLVIQKTKIKIANCTLRDKYDEIFNEILGMKELIDVFFKEVVIMTDNYALKSNRVSIVNCVKNIFIEFVDFSYIIFD